MLPQEIEPELAALFDRLTPGWQQDCRGARDGEIEKVERSCKRPLPDFYRWFLSRMGQSMGPFSFSRIDATVSTVIEILEESGGPDRDRLVPLGRSVSQAEPFTLCYDLDRRSRGDAFVVSVFDGDDAALPWFETFREMIAWSAVTEFIINDFPYHCSGSWIDGGGSVLERIAAPASHLGFSEPVSTGAYCGIFVREDVAMTTSASFDVGPKIHSFELGGNDRETLRKVLGEIQLASSADLKINEWSETR